MYCSVFVTNVINDCYECDGKFSKVFKWCWVIVKEEVENGKTGVL